MDKIDITIIGAGVVGLAVAAEVAKHGRSCIVLEKNHKFGQETSSRNSEVIHSGIYYPQNTLKAKLCVEGNPLLYEYCKNNSINHSKLGKVIVATEPDEIAQLEKLKENGTKNGVKDLVMLTKKQVNNMEPDVNALAGLLSPSTGIIDTHTLMQKYLNQALAQEAIISYDSEVCGIEKTGSGFIVTVKKDNFQFETGTLINCAGLNSDTIAGLCGIDIEKANYKLFYCKGNYFRTSRKFNVKKLIYPVPTHNIKSLGIHLTLDLAGGMRFGPDANYLDLIDYSIDESQKHAFYDSITKYLPGITLDSLYPDTSGIRPKLQGPNDGFKDFVIEKETKYKLPGLINLIGIESPGLTASLAIARYVHTLI